jgi:hypothetical protein
MLSDDSNGPVKTSTRANWLSKTILFLLVFLIIATLANEAMRLGYYFGLSHRHLHPTIQRSLGLAAIETLLFVAGLWLLLAGRTPNKVFQLLFVRGNYQLAPRRARLLGLLLVSPFPLAYAISSLLATFAPNVSPQISLVFEVIYVFIVVILAIRMAFKSRLPSQQSQD